MKNNEFLSERELLSGIYTEIKEIKNKLPDRTKEAITDIGFIDNSELCRAMNISKKTAAAWRRSYKANTPFFTINFFALFAMTALDEKEKGRTKKVRPSVV